jgi:diazepam-binding inhibitor (GABA receptor modulating acyl-CoA-binding protein)
MNKDLNIKFEKAYIVASETQLKLPPDIMLKFYAYYKQATKGNDYKQSKSDGIELRNAFKLNAWLQLNHLSADEAKQHYIKLVNKHLKPQK